MCGREVLFELAVTKAWLRQVIVGLTLICRSSYRGVVEFLRDLLGRACKIVGGWRGRDRVRVHGARAGGWRS